MKFKFKWTKTRSVIYKFLEQAKSPADAFEILDHLRSKRMGTNKVTVYRVLELFEQSDIIRKIEFGEGKSRYELKRGDHHHLICTKCSRIQDFEENFIERLEKEVQKNKNFKVQYHLLELFGICSRHN